MKDNWTCSVGCTNTSKCTNIRTTWNRNSIIIYTNNTDWKTRRLWIVLDNTILVVMKSTFQQVCFATKQKLPTTLGILHAYAMQHGEGADGVHWIECIFVQKGGTLASACLDMASPASKVELHRQWTERNAGELPNVLPLPFVAFDIASWRHKSKSKNTTKQYNYSSSEKSNQTHTFMKHTLQFWKTHPAVLNQGKINLETHISRKLQFLW